MKNNTFTTLVFGVAICYLYLRVRELEKELIRTDKLLYETVDTFIFAERKRNDRD